MLHRDRFRSSRCFSDIRDLLAVGCWAGSLVPSVLQRGHPLSAHLSSVPATTLAADVHHHRPGQPHQHCEGDCDRRGPGHRPGLLVADVSREGTPGGVVAAALHARCCWFASLLAALAAGSGCCGLWAASCSQPLLPANAEKQLQMQRLQPPRGAARKQPAQQSSSCSFCWAGSARHQHGAQRVASCCWHSLRTFKPTPSLLPRPAATTGTRPRSGRTTTGSASAFVCFCCVLHGCCTTWRTCDCCCTCVSP